LYSCWCGVVYPEDGNQVSGLGELGRELEEGRRRQELGEVDIEAMLGRGRRCLVAAFRGSVVSRASGRSGW
jgi:hypothetical protein